MNTIYSIDNNAVDTAIRFGGGMNISNPFLPWAAARKGTSEHYCLKWGRGDRGAVLTPGICPSARLSDDYGIGLEVRIQRHHQALLVAGSSTVAAIDHPDAAIPIIFNHMLEPTSRVVSDHGIELKPTHEGDSSAAPKGRGTSYDATSGDVAYSMLAKQRLEEFVKWVAVPVLQNASVGYSPVMHAGLELIALRLLTTAKRPLDLNALKTDVETRWDVYATVQQAAA